MKTKIKKIAQEIIGKKVIKEEPKKDENKTGNIIVLKCDQDYAETYYVTYAHLYPNSAKVKVGDSVSHWTEIASVGTTGHSTGNHLHYQVADANWNLIDGMQLIDFNSVTDYSNQLEYKPPQEALPLLYK